MVDADGASRRYRTVYLGGAGVIAALHRLAQRGFVELRRDYVPYLERSLDAEPDFPDEDGQRSHPRHAIVRKVKSTGVFSFRGLAINIGSRFAGASVRIVENEGLVRVYVGDELVRTLAPDRERRYQQLGRRRGGEVEIRA